MSGRFDGREKRIEQIRVELQRLKKENKNCFRIGCVGLGILSLTIPMMLLHVSWPLNSVPLFAGFGLYVAARIKMFRIGERLDEIGQELGRY